VVSVNVQADQFASGSASDDPWVGVVARYVDGANYYYVSLRKSGLVSLRKRVNNSIVGLGSVTLPITPGTNYNVRLEAIGGSLRVYVDGNLRIERKDPSLPAGTYGIATYKAAAKFTTFQVYQP
jgi:hypothetical protein